MASRVYFSSSDATRSTTTSTTYQNKLDLTFTPNANKTYAIFAFATADNASSFSDVFVRLRHDTAATTLKEFNLEAQDTTDLYSCPMLAVYTAPGSPTSQTFSIEFRSESGSTVGVRDCRLIALELTANDLFDQTLGTVTRTTNGTDTTASVTLSAGSWLVIGSVGIASTGGLTGSFDLHNATGPVVYATDPVGVSKDSSNFRPFWALRRVTAAGAETVSTRQTRGSGGNWSSKERCIIAFKLSDFPAEYSDEEPTSATRGGAGSDSPLARASATQTTEAADHLFLGSAWTQNLQSVSTSVLADFTMDGAALLTALTRESGTLDWRFQQGFGAVVDLTAASHTFTARWWNESTATTGIEQASVYLLQLEDTAAPEVEGTGAGTLSALTGSASGVRGATGTAAGTTAALTGAATGASLVTGTAEGTLAAATGSATGAHGVTGSAAGTLGALTGSATALTAVTGTAQGTLGAVTGSATGAHGATATAAGSLEAVTGSASGAHGVAGTAAGTLAVATGTASGVHGVAGTAAGTLSAVTGSATGQFGQDAVEGTAAGTLAVLTGAATGVVAVIGSAAGALAALAGSAAGESEGEEEAPAPQPPRQVGLAIPIRPRRKKKAKPVEGRGAGTLPALGGEAHGVVGVATVWAPRPRIRERNYPRAAATSHVAVRLPALSGAATGYLPPTGTAVATLPALTGSIAVRFDHHTDEELALIAAALAA